MLELVGRNRWHLLMISVEKCKETSLGSCRTFNSSESEIISGSLDVPQIP